MNYEYFGKHFSLYDKNYEEQLNLNYKEKKRFSNLQLWILTL